MKTFIAPGSEFHDRGDRSGDVTSVAAEEMLCVGPEGCGRVVYGDHNTQRICAGSRCMAWRWGMPLIERTPYLEIDPSSGKVRAIGTEQLSIGLHKELMDTAPEGDGWTFDPARGNLGYWHRLSVRRGHCFFTNEAKK